jgi:hypothetical protein
MAGLHRWLVAMKRFPIPDPLYQPAQINQMIAGLMAEDVKPEDKAFTMMLLARLAVMPNRKVNDNTKPIVNDPLGTIDKLLNLFVSPQAPGKSAHQEALIMYALSDTLLTLESPKRNPGRPLQKDPVNNTELAPVLTKLRQITLLRYYRMISAQTELGGLWPDPVNSMLYLVAAEHLKATGLFREFRSRKQLTAGKKQDEKPVLPEIVMNLPLDQLAVWIGVKDPGLKAKENQLRMKFTTEIWERNQYLNFAREQTRYLVDENGIVTGANQALATGAFLSLEALGD